MELQRCQPSKKLLLHIFENQAKALLPDDIYALYVVFERSKNLFDSEITYNYSISQCMDNINQAEH